MNEPPNFHIPHTDGSVFMSNKTLRKVNQNTFHPPPAILKSFACTSANSPQQKPKDDSRTITSVGERQKVWKTAEFFVRKEAYQRCSPLQHPTTMTKGIRDLMSKFCIYIYTLKKPLQIISLFRLPPGCLLH